MRPTDLLEQEHRYIQKVADALVLEADAIEHEGTADFALLQQVVEFLREFADLRHNSKEESVLFPILEERGLPPAGDPLGTLKHDHEVVRSLVAALAGIAARTRRGEDVPVNEIVKCLRDLADLYSGLIRKENYQLFPMAQKVLNTNDEAEVLRLFGQSDWLMGTEQHDKYERFAEGISPRAGCGGVRRGIADST